MGRNAQKRRARRMKHDAVDNETAAAGNHLQAASLASSHLQSQGAPETNWLCRTIREPAPMSPTEKTSLARVLLQTTALMMRGDEQKAATQIGEYLQAEGFSVFLFSDGQESVSTFAHYRKYRDGQGKNPLGDDLPLSLYRSCVQSRKSFRSENVQTDARLPVGYGMKNQIGSLVIAPMQIGDQVFGVVVVGRRETRGFQKKQERDLIRLANRMGADLQQRRYQILANTEPLTGGLNRSSFLIHLKQETARAGRWNMPLALVMTEVDELEKINRQWGREAGDALLCYVSDRLSEMVRGIDVCGRIDDDAFAVLLPGITSAEAEMAVRRWLDQMSEHPCVYENEKIEFTLSVGIAALGKDEKDGLQMLAQAQMALEDIKGTKELNICVVDESKLNNGVEE